MTTSFDLFGTLVDAERPEDPAAALTDALAARGVDAAREPVSEATVAAFDTPVRRRDGALAAVDAARERGPVAVLSNCSVPGLVERTLDRAGLAEEFDAAVASVDCGWRKPDERAFRAVADALDAEPAELVHVGDDPDTDGGVEAVGGSPILLTETTLPELPDLLEVRA